jgi:hypothetical protein
MKTNLKPQNAEKILFLNAMRQYEVEKWDLVVCALQRCGKKGLRFWHFWFLVFMLLQKWPY